MTAQDLALILGAYTALVVPVMGYLIKVAFDTRKQATDANHAVNGRAHDEPTLRELVERIDIDLDILARDSSRRHDSNSRRIDRLTRAMEGANERLDALEGDDG